MALDSLAKDARGNEFAGNLDHITGQTITDARAATASLGALNAEAVVDVIGHSTLMVNLQTAAASLTVVFEGTVDGTNYFPLSATDGSTLSMVASITSTTTMSKNVVCACMGFRRVRVRVSAFTSGAMVVAMRATVAARPPGAVPDLPTTLWVTATAAANTAVTATLPLVAGMFHHITHINITRNATAALAGTATIIHTTTNLPGSPAWSVGNAMAAGGTQIDVVLDLAAAPLRSSVAGTATTVVAAAGGLAVLGRVNVGYYLAP